MTLKDRETRCWACARVGITPLHKPRLSESYFLGGEKKGIRKEQLFPEKKDIPRNLSVLPWALCGKKECLT